MAENPIRRILAPTDFSEHSERATAYAAKLARQLNASLVLVHIVEVPIYGSPFPAPRVTDIGSQCAEIARETLETATKLLRATGLSVEVFVEEGTAWRGIIDAATRQRADVIVMATHGRSGLPRALMGSVAEKVLRMSPVPVLTVSLRANEIPTAEPAT